ncbi:hypothetical protein [Streptomyces sp. NPDC059783]|uniref:hypothetical protein n=1 Tax=Streptomyces sp. NPDC059783 TaxID=3346944 RepID=UPI003652AB31
MTDRDQLLHLADRARRGALLPDEGALLADAVAATLDRLDRLRRSRNLWADHTARLTERADRAEAAIGRVRDLHRQTCLVHRYSLRAIACFTCEALDEQQPTTEVLRDDGHPICTCTYDTPRCPACQTEQPTTESDTE